MQIAENISLSEKTTLRVGGPARFFCAPAHETEVLECVHWAQQRKMPLLVLGRGSNVCISDAGWAGLVVYLGSAFSRIEWVDAAVTCQAGALLHTLVRKAVARGLAGIECLAGIPGSVGGAVVMNAGAFGRQIGDVTNEVMFVDIESGCSRTLLADELHFGYRHSALQEPNRLVLRVRMCLEAGQSRQALETALYDIVERRRAKQPLEIPNCGSVFKNPPGRGAGRHVEAAGLKGFSIGGMQVSPKHANFIVNTGGGCAADFRSLVAHVQKVVRERTRVDLEPEVRFIGHFD